MEELKTILVESLYIWIGAYNIFMFQTILNLWIFVLLLPNNDSPYIYNVY
jgi:hypothetical protein